MLSYTKEIFLSKLPQSHLDKYSYEKAEYVTCDVKIQIWFKTHKEYYWQAPYMHLTGQGCTKCGMETISKQKSQSQKKDFII